MTLVPHPPPEFTPYPNQPEVTLVPGEQQSVEIILENLSPLAYKVNFTIVEQSNNELENVEIDLKYANVEQVIPANSLITTPINIKAPLAINSKITYTIIVSAEIQRLDDLITEYKEDHFESAIDSFVPYEDSPEILNTTFSVSILSTWDALWLFLQRTKVILGIIIAIAGVMGIVRKFLKRKQTK